MADHINEVNAIIRMYEKDSEYEIIDLFEEFVNENGLIKANLTSDGTHLNELGYKVWVKLVISRL